MTLAQVSVSTSQPGLPLGYLRSVFNVLHQLEESGYPNPLARVKPLRLQEKELAYLTDAQVDHLFQVIHERCRTPTSP